MIPEDLDKELKRLRKYIKNLRSNVISKRVAVEDDYADDAAAELGGIEIGGEYHTSGTVKIRLS